MARKILGVFEVFLGIFEKTKEKKDRVHNKAIILHPKKAPSSLKNPAMLACDARK